LGAKLSNQVGAYVTCMTCNINYLHVISGAIPSFFSMNADVVQTDPTTTVDTDTVHYSIKTNDDTVMNVTLHPNKNLLSRE